MGISINIEGETKERQEKLSKKLKGKNSDKKLYKRGYSLTTKLRWDQPGAELPQFPAPAFQTSQLSDSMVNLFFLKGEQSDIWEIGVGWWLC